MTGRRCEVYCGGYIRTKKGLVDPSSSCLELIVGSAVNGIRR
jgi:hypothetical protein